MLRVALKDVPGRERWGIAAPAVVEVMNEIARAFGMREVEQGVWDTNNVLLFPGTIWTR